MTCPLCNSELTIDPACEISYPPHTETKIAPAALCNNCEYCVELDVVHLNAGVTVPRLPTSKERS